MCSLLLGSTSQAAACSYFSVMRPLRLPRLQGESWGWPQVWKKPVSWLLLLLNRPHLGTVYTQQRAPVSGVRCDAEFCKCVQSCDLHHTETQSNSVTAKVSCASLKQTLPPSSQRPPAPSSGSAACHSDFDFPDAFYKWNHTLCVLLCLASPAGTLIVTFTHVLFLCTAEEVPLRAVPQRANP